MLNTNALQNLIYHWRTSPDTIGEYLPEIISAMESGSKIPCGYLQKHTDKRCADLASGLYKFKARSGQISFFIVAPLCTTHATELEALPNPVTLSAIRFPLGDTTCAQVLYSENSDGGNPEGNGLPKTILDPLP